MSGVEKRDFEKSWLRTIANAVSSYGEQFARDALPFAFGSLVDVSGKVRKVVKGNTYFKILIEPVDVPELVVFAECISDTEMVEVRKIGEGELVQLKGKLSGFSASAVYLNDCRLVSTSERVEVTSNSIKKKSDVEKKPHGVTLMAMERKKA